MNRILKGIRKIAYYIFANFVGRIMYSKEYFPKGRWFKTWKSDGWGWVIRDFWGRLFLHRNNGIKWPVSPLVTIGSDNISFHIDNIDNFQSAGCYYQSYDANIHLGYGVYIAQGTGIITSNHDVNNLEQRSGAKDVVIGDHSWIGMNSIILPGVVLGEKTIVGAGSVVTHSFEQGHCVIVGNPARVIREL